MNADSVRKTKRTTTVRKHERGLYDRDTVYSIIDSTPLCHVSYIIDDWPYVTPTIQWREDDRIFWHGSSASRFLRQIRNKPACIAVTHFDGIVLARSASHHRRIIYGDRRRVCQSPDWTFCRRRRRLFPFYMGRHNPYNPGSGSARTRSEESTRHTHA